MTFVQVLSEANFKSRKIRLKGLEAGALYRLEETGEVYSGAVLMNGGFLVKRDFGDFISHLYHFEKIS